MKYRAEWLVTSAGVPTDLIGEAMHSIDSDDLGGSAVRLGPVVSVIVRFEADSDEAAVEAARAVRFHNAPSDLLTIRVGRGRNARNVAH